VSVCVLGTRVDPAKTAEPIAGCFKMGRRLVCPEGTISGVQISPTGRGTFERGDVELPPRTLLNSVLIAQLLKQSGFTFNLPSEKNPPPTRCGLSSDFFDHEKSVPYKSFDFDTWRAG